jgi:hypothetical protein
MLNLNRDMMDLFIGALDGDGSAAIDRQQARYQRELADPREQRLPIKGERYSGDYHAKLQALGFTIGDAINELFMKVTMPTGWTIQATDHSMWSNLVDDKGRKRASMFYKGAFYDRDAFLTFNRRFSISSEIPDHDEEQFHQKDEFIITGHKPELVPDEEAINRLEKWGRKISRNNEEMVIYEDMGRTLIYQAGTPMKQVNKPIYAPNPEYVKLTGYEKYSQPFHFEVLDHDDKVLFSSDVVKTDYDWSKAMHSEFFSHHEEVCQKAKQQCINWLNENYPEWESVLSHWD